MLLLLAPASAWACWDGVTVSDGPICISWAESDGEIPFSLEGARAAAQSIRRLQPLLARGETIDVVFGRYESSCGAALIDDEVEGAAGIRICPKAGECRTLPLDHQDLDAAVEAMAVHSGRTASNRASARIWTVQVIAAQGATPAEVMETRLEDYAPGFYVVAGHPGRATATEMAFDGTWHRVMVGAFLDRRSAAKAKEELLQERGIEGWVRVVP